MPPGFAFCWAVAFFHWMHPAGRAMPHFSVRKQLLTVLVVPLSQANCHQLHPPHSQQFGCRFGAGLGFLPACLPFGCWYAMAAEPWWLFSLAASAASRSVVWDRPSLARRLRARTRCLRLLSCNDLDNVFSKVPK